ncbi:rhomboid family intramembrane serine protease [Limnoglobus roseus]|uniref:Peptidase S54 rhomboid domain-containing protein n=1 Tax=Limnoglobus roseus TaxID=2598579 RepID=A0A5C1ANP3_9BACT|nr:rhomboid family intramembrane serine protease [Limnoglobus roseus]QEL18478.1 hypothetical protein PX52LOC_05503 [Limnoglobus roseus]
MGLYDREYYREEHARREVWQIGPVTLGLIGVMVAVFFLQLAMINIREYLTYYDPLLYWGGFSLDKILDGEVWRLLTSLFLHHPAQNLWLFAASLVILAYCGRSVEGTYGPKEMFWYYVLTGLVTQLALFAVSYFRPFNFEPPDPGYGCSGPVVAVMVLFALHAPNSQVPLLFGSVRAAPLAAVIILVNLALFALNPRQAFGAISALSGAAFAFAYHQNHWRVSNWIPDLPGLRKTQTRSPIKSRPLFQDDPPEPSTPIDLRRPAEPPEPVPTPAITSPATVHEYLEAQLDQVLSKVAQHGKASLTPTEQEILLRASEVYKSRRK